MMFLSLDFEGGAQEVNYIKEQNSVEVESRANFQNYKINWYSVQKTKDFNGEAISYLSFKGAVVDPNIHWLPHYTESRKVGISTQTADVKLKNTKYIACTPEENAVLYKLRNHLSNQIQISSYVSYVKKEAFLEINFVPIIHKGGNQYEKLVDFEIEVVEKAETASTKRNKRSRTFKVQSVLRSGEWYKFGVHTDGIHKIAYSTLANIGAQIQGLQSDRIRLFGNGGGMLPVSNSEERLDDLEEIAIWVEDGGDGRFDPGDYILFYGESQHRWKNTGSSFTHDLNYMADTTFYFFTADYQMGLPKRIKQAPVISAAPTVTINKFDDYAFHERDVSNLIKSGRKWFGESFGVKKQYTFPFNFSGISTTDPVLVRAAVASRVIGRPSSFTLGVNNTTLFSIQINEVVSPGYGSQYAFEGFGEGTFLPSSGRLDVSLGFNNNSSVDNGWLDYIEVICKRNLIYSSNQLRFRALQSLNNSVVKYEISTPLNSMQIWDVTNHNSIQSIVGKIESGRYTFLAEGNVLREFVAFHGDNFPEPIFSSKIANQDLHALTQADYIILTHPLFESEANQLADFHRAFNKLKVHVVDINKVYNEFSGGSQDITAIKDLMKMFYDRAGLDTSKMPKYLLLFGDASYDYKNRISGNTNMIPAFQSLNSVSPTRSFITDDYFGFLDDSESDALTSSLDIGIGRFPVHTKAQAQNVLNKIFRYHQTPSVFGSWRTWLTFVGDDEDSNIHMAQANALSNRVSNEHPRYNVNKILFDAYPQQISSAGQTYPQVNEAINNAMNRGTLLMTYVGHGGETGWAHERVLTIPEINRWSHAPFFPVFLTATCEFSRFDDPLRTSAGELTLLNPDGGAIALLTTTRLVYSSPNYELANTFIDYAFSKINGKYPTLGDLLRECKRTSNINQLNAINYRNFSLLGDPAMRMAYPEFNIQTTLAPDTIQGLQKVTIKGMVSDFNGEKLSDFNGIVYPTVFDKERTIVSLNNDGVGPFTFQTQTNTVFRGKATVANGDFEFSFVVPKNIDFQFGNARISYYATDGNTDAAGNDNAVRIGGRFDGAAEDKVGPDINLWMNDEKFVIGGITDNNPILLARFFDESGINTVGNGVGQNIQAVLDENTADAIILNDYYESETDSYQKGVIRYPFKNMKEGKHTLRMKAWDVYNNSGESFTEFIVANSSELALRNVLNYPNPFTTNTAFHFDHNAAGQALQIRIQIFTISGKLVKTIDADYVSDGFHAGPFYWNGLDEYGDKIGKGVYVYKVSVVSVSGAKAQEYEKLVILN